jgi:hypothetical protein
LLRAAGIKEGEMKKLFGAIGVLAVVLAATPALAGGGWGFGIPAIGVAVGPKGGVAVNVGGIGVAVGARGGVAVGVGGGYGGYGYGPPVYVAPPVPVYYAPPVYVPVPVYYQAVPAFLTPNGGVIFVPEPRYGPPNGGQGGYGQQPGPMAP